MKFTVFGAEGYVGKALVSHLESRRREVSAVARHQIADLSGNLGHVIYTIGVTADFRTRLSDTIDAHVSLLKSLMLEHDFESWLYLSSTRIYGARDVGAPASETDEIRVTPGPDAIYDLSKLLGESWCLSHSAPTVRIARLSNVFSEEPAPDTFLGSVLQSLQHDGHVTVREDPRSSKDYVNLADVVEQLENIAIHGKHRIYNVASGRQTPHLQLLGEISKFTNGTFDFEKGATLRRFPSINVDRLRDEFGYAPRDVMEIVGRMCQ